MKFQLGARTLLSVPRRLTRIAWSLDDALAESEPQLREASGDGWLLTSVPEPLLGAILTGSGSDHLVHIRQRYHRYWIDLAAGEPAWRADLSANARAQIKRKAKKLGSHRIERFRSPAEIAGFHPRARAVSARTYQERLLSSGLPADPAGLLDLAAADRVRAWLLSVDDTPVAYLCCTADGDTLRYDHVGHDPAWNDRSPGAVLQAAALADLFADRFARFDFTEGEGQHKRQLATGGIACADVLVLCATPANRMLLAALRGWEATIAAGKRMTWSKKVAARLRR